MTLIFGLSERDGLILDKCELCQAKMGVKHILAHTGHFYFILEFPYNYDRPCQGKVGVINSLSHTGRFYNK